MAGVHEGETWVYDRLAVAEEGFHSACAPDGVMFVFEVVGRDRFTG